MADRDILDRKLQALERLHDDTAKIINNYDGEPTPTSQAQSELQTPLTLLSGLLIPPEENLSTAFIQAALFVESAADHLIALKRTLTEPVLTIASWTCLRTLIESSALACWLIDPRDNASTRIARGFAYRYEDLCQQKAFAHSVGNNVGASKVDIRLNEVERDALTLGYPRILDKKGKRRGIGQQMPMLSDLVRDMLDQEAIYRASSAIIHGNSSAIVQLSFQKNNTDQAHRYGVSVDMYEKSLTLPRLSELCSIAAMSFAKPIWFKSVLYGWDQTETSRVLDNASDALEIDPSQRFWKPVTTP